ncbi:MAG TPA: hypothetical protein VMU87_16310 [Stellaceae bacterium]|nr:hypothetical protein [Stellaceae bacterium]
MGLSAIHHRIVCCHYATELEEAFALLDRLAARWRVLESYEECLADGERAMAAERYERTRRVSDLVSRSAGLLFGAADLLRGDPTVVSRKPGSA